MKTIEVSDEAYRVINTHARANGESTANAIDELVEVAFNAWTMDMPEMREPWAKFNEYNNKINR